MRFPPVVEFRFVAAVRNGLSSDILGNRETANENDIRTGIGAMTHATIWLGRPGTLRTRPLRRRLRSAGSAAGASHISRRGPSSPVWGSPGCAAPHGSRHRNWEIFARLRHPRNQKYQVRYRYAFTGGARIPASAGMASSGIASPNSAKTLPDTVAASLRE